MAHVHWRGPASMLGALFAGILLSVAHHLFYQSLHKQAVTDGYYDIALFSTSRQQFNTAVGTALAFAVRSVLALAISTAFVQLFWIRLAATSRKPLAVHHINAAFSVPRNVFMLFNVSGWWQFPLLFSMALIVWLLPIASITTPGTLSIINREQTPSPWSMTKVPGVRFDTLSYLAGLTTEPTLRDPEEIALYPYMDGIYSYRGPSQALGRVAAAVGSQGNILPINAPSPNSSWIAEFNGPLLRCRTLPHSDQLEVQLNIASYLSSNGGAHQDTPDAYRVWHGDLPYVEDEPVSSDESAPQNMSKTNYNLQATDGGSKAGFRMAIFPQLLQVDNSSGLREDRSWTYMQFDSNRGVFARPTNDPLADGDRNSTVLQCDMVASSYSIQFNFTNGEQSVSFIDADDQLQNPVTILKEVYGPNTQCPGLSRESPKPGQAQNCDIDRSVAIQLSYQAILDAFLDLVGGSIGLNGPNMVVDSRVVETVLVNTYELDFLTDYTFQRTKASNPTIQVAFSNSGHADMAGLLEPLTTDSRHSISAGLEMLFQNFTVSLMSSPYFRLPEESSSERNVSTITYHNIYIYTEYKLWLAYGIAIFLTMAAVTLGLCAIYLNGVSYSNDFSTLLRVSRHAELNTEIDSKDDGSDPLPRHIDKATFTVSNEIAIATNEARLAEEVCAFSDGQTKTLDVHQPFLNEERQHVHFGAQRHSTW